MRVYMFPGQGTQVRGMGKPLFDRFPELTARADEILGYSIRELCVLDPASRLDATEFTQPAIYVTNALTFFQSIEDDTRLPDYALGHSLGEYNALLAAGAFDFETGLKLVKKRGELMGQARDGGMAAVIGLGEAKVREILDENRAEPVSIANINGVAQIVLAGPKTWIDELKPAFVRAGARYVVLRVSAAFHSRYMSAAASEFSRLAASCHFAVPNIPVISNSTARPYDHRLVAETLSEQIVKPVRWCESIRYLMGKGATDFVEIGQGRVLTGLCEEIRRSSEPLLVDDAPKAPAWGAPVRSRSAEALGSPEFREDYGVRLAYAVGSLPDGISSEGMIVRLAKAGLIGYFGAKGLAPDAIEGAVRGIQGRLRSGEPYGVSLYPDQGEATSEWETVERYLKLNVANLEASGYLTVTPALVHFRLKGASRGADGGARAPRRILARVRHPELIRTFMSPAPAHIVSHLVERGHLTSEEARLGREIPLSDDICVEADNAESASGWIMLPSALRMRDELGRTFGYKRRIRVGLSGELGAPGAMACVFLLGADFVVTDVINQCSPEALTSDRAKDMLQAARVEDTTYIPGEEMLEMGAKVRVLKRGVLFPARANRLYEIFRQHASLKDLDARTREQLESRYFKCTLEEIDHAARAQDPKREMASIFQWYYRRAARMARRGDESQVDYLVHCTPAMGAFNLEVSGTELEDWRHRHVDAIALRLMERAAAFGGTPNEVVAGR